jgi:hypothetical protein
MTDLAIIRTCIPTYADYANEDARHEVDKQIRAWIGEALSDARVRISPSGGVGERLDGMVLRCEFSDQRVIRAADHARFDQTLIDRVHQLDRELIEMSGRVRAASNEDELSSALDEVARLLDERFGAIADAPSS